MRTLTLTLTLTLSLVLAVCAPTPIEDPAAEDAPVGEAPADGAPADGAAAEDAPAEDAPADDAPAEDVDPTSDEAPEDGPDEVPEEAPEAPEAPPEEAPDEGPALETQLVMDEVRFLPAGDGFDLTGDGAADNGLSALFEDPMLGDALGGDPNDYLARSVRRGELLLLLDFHRLSDHADDASFDLEMMLGADTDGRRRNNFRGEGVFVPRCDALDGDGAATGGFEGASLSAGRIQGEGGRFPFLISFAGGLEVVLQQARIVGDLGPDGASLADGMMGGAVSYDDLVEVVENDPEIGPGFGGLMLAFFRARLDVDLDADGTPDALSAAFAFTAVAATIDRDRPCAD